MDAPLPSDNWPVLSASALPWSSANPVPKAMDRSDMDRVRDEFVAATQMAARCGFDMIEPCRFRQSKGRLKVRQK
jgi:anthraniloyl-CoA monooxygenase